MMHVLELAPEVANMLGRDSLFEECAPGEPKLGAFATFLHETVHWWQHVGTTSGLISALSRATQAHVIARSLKNQPATAARLSKPGYSARTLLSTPEIMPHNLAVNGWMDLEFATVLLSTPDVGHRIVHDNFFDCLGLSYSAYINETCGLLRTTIEDASFLPNSWNSSDVFDRLRREGVVGYAPREPIV